MNVSRFFSVLALWMMGLFLLGAGLARACRLVTVVSTTPQPALVERVFIKESRSLLHQAHSTEPYYQTAGQSLSVNLLGPVVPTVDGVGLAAFDPAGAFFKDYYYRNATSLEEPAAAQQFKQSVEQVSPYASVVLGNLRAKTQGAVDASNNHPFRVTLGNAPQKTWVFMANGGTRITPKMYNTAIRDTRFKASPNRQAVMTDTEMLFHLLLQEALPILSAPTINRDALAQQFATTYARVQGDISPSLFTPLSEGKGYSELGESHVFTEDSRFLRYWPKTWAMSNGVYTFIMVHGYDQWVQVHQDGEGHAQSLVFASEPTNIREYYTAGESMPAGSSRWQQIPQDTLVAAFLEEGQVKMKLYPVVIQQKQYPKTHHRGGVGLVKLAPAGTLAGH
jgi:hypothetical protein